MMTLLNLYQRAARQGIEVDYCPMRELVSASFPEGWIVMDVDKVKDSQEEKVILAHELGHCETGSFYNVDSCLDIRAKHERRAEKKAIETLISKEELTAAVQQGRTEIWELAEFFSVPYEFMERAVLFYQNKDW